MPDLAPFLPGLAVALMAAVLLWFAFGTQINVRRGNRLLAWLQDGLPLLGPRTTLRWLGSSVAELRIADAAAPFRKAEVLVVLEPRDLGLLWALARRRGRRDFLLLRLDLVRAPRMRADAIDPGAWTAGDRRVDDVPPERRTSWTDGAGASVELVHDTDADLDALRAAWSRMAAVPAQPWRISVRPTVPHLEIHLIPPAPDKADSRRLMDEVRRLATELSRA